MARITITNNAWVVVRQLDDDEIGALHLTSDSDALAAAIAEAVEEARDDDTDVASG